uniref:quinolinate synthase NadA n=1 Tax=Agathobacter sp. TaxID=2021311 RepID=UPI004056C52A
MRIADEIKKLKKEKDAVILAHYYTSPEVQDIADYVGDSYYLSKLAVKLLQEKIIFCGVSFMGESACILNPGKKVFMPDLTADCAMAHMADAETIKRMRETYEDLAVVCYINSTAELKQHSDVCVTSANAVKIVKALPNKNIFLIPDKNLAHYVAAQIPEKNFIFNEGYCPIHEMMLEEEVRKLKTSHADAPVLVHPECNEKIREMADFVGSTSQIIEYAEKCEAKELIIGTEIGVLYELKKRCPYKFFYFPQTKPVCEDMKKITLRKIYQILLEEENEIFVSEELRTHSKKPLEQMLALAK